MSGSPNPVPSALQLENYLPTVAAAVINNQTLTTNKEPVRVASAANISNLSSVTVANFDGTSQGVTLVAGDRVLVKNPASKDGVESASAKREGIYVVGTVTSGSAPLTRDADAATSPMVTCGMTCSVNEGTYAGESFILTTANSITLDTTLLTFQSTANNLGGTVVSTSPAQAGQSLLSSSSSTAIWSTDVGTYHDVRGVVTANVASLASFTVAGNDNLTYIAGDRVLLAGQTTDSQSGIYVVGTVTTGTAPLTRAVDWAAASIQPTASLILASEGLTWAGQFWSPSTTGGITVGTTAPAFTPRPPAAGHTVRNLILTNVASLSSYTVASGAQNDNVSGGNVQGDRVLLVAQTTAAQNGIYIVGPVTTGTAALTRASDWWTGMVLPSASSVTVSESGSVFANSTWFASVTGGVTVGTTAPAFYPRRYVRVTTAMSGTPGTKALSAEWILSATASFVTVTVKAPGTQGFLSIGALSTGAGNGSFTVTSTANETSTLQVVIEN